MGEITKKELVPELQLDIQKGKQAEQNTKDYIDQYFQKPKLTNDTVAKSVPNGNWNDVTETGFYMASNALNQPFMLGASDLWMGIHIMQNLSNAFQQVTDLDNRGSFTRSKKDGRWLPWKKMLDDDPGNYSPIIYVDGVNGNDSNPGDWFSPKKTISGTINSMPKFSQFERTIMVNNVTPTYSESSVNFTNFSGGKISLIVNGSGEIKLNTTGGIWINDCSAPIVIRDVNLTGSWTEIAVSNSLMVSLIRITSTATLANRSAILVGDVSHCKISNCTLSNKGNGVNVTRSAVYLERVSGTGNQTGLRCVGGVIYKDGFSSITGTTPTVRSDGGQIFT